MVANLFSYKEYFEFSITNPIDNITLSSDFVWMDNGISGCYLETVNS